MYIDNQSIGKDVWFDNLVVGHYESEVLEEDHYYPHGLTLNITPNTATMTGQPYKYNTKELETHFGLESYDYGARMFDPQLGVWHVPDPLAEISRRWSPYTYCYDNPIRFIDPDGMKVVNGYQDAVNRTEKEMNGSMAKFNEKYDGGKTKDDFKGDKAGWKEYKKDEEVLNKSIDEYNTAKEDYNDAQARIENFAEVDPENFAKVDNLTYKDNAGTEHNLDVIVKFGKSGFQGGATTFSFNKEKGQITGNRLITRIDRRQSTTSDVLAHEFGHAFDDAKNPLKVYNAMISLPDNYDCQNVSTRVADFSGTAIEWQWRYNDLYKKRKN